MARSRFRQPSILPGFGLTLGFTTFSSQESRYSATV